MIPLIGEMSAKQTKGCPNSENFAPAAYAPSDEGAVKCTAFDWGRDFFISLPPAFAYGKSHLPPRGRNNGSSRRRPLQRGAESSPPTLELHFYFSIGTVKTVPYAQNIFYRVGRGLAPAVNSHRTLRRGQNSPNSGTLLSASQTFPLTGESPRPTLILYFVRSKNTPTNSNMLS